jgi:hypothetical protein
VHIDKQTALLTVEICDSICFVKGADLKLIVQCSHSLFVVLKPSCIFDI